MTLDYQPPFDQVTDVLWRNGGGKVAVKLGSGLSQNAREKMSNGRRARCSKASETSCFGLLPPGRHRGMDHLMQELRYDREETDATLLNSPNMVVIHRSASGTRPQKLKMPPIVR